ncbi:hypothetical protein WR25_26894 [Diploscapter pachys]|uniref:UBC core domain-containing protein n=1 Tax=Diploscapter pachys TaxID=2018661 RepID=A0A2A2J776_9BILA|nr:hypothetical protein WR25_26894 [Diploscapter pachys]
MTTPSRRRLMRDFKKLQEDPPAGVSGAPTEDNILAWEAIIFGPQDTPFEDGTFKLSLEFTEEYPNKPPTVKFISKMFHPNVYADGSICLDILQSWLNFGENEGDAEPKDEPKEASGTGGQQLNESRREQSQGVGQNQNETGASGSGEAAAGSAASANEEMPSASGSN